MTLSIASVKLSNTSLWSVLLIFSCLCFLIIHDHYIFQFNGNIYINLKNRHKQNEILDPCLGKYIYIHNLPSKFNDDIIKNCSITRLHDICESISNFGFGPQLIKIFDDDDVLGNNNNKGWYKTNQFVLEIIFRHRMNQYKCLTNDSSLASAIYVPYYAGLDVARYRGGGYNTSVRDSNAIDLVKWLSGKGEWKRMWGGDHFFVAGRITWDFRRPVDDESAAWGNKLMLLPEAKNMTMLTIESSPWSDKDVAIPYPTYFHPSTDAEVSIWQNKLKRKKRQYLFSFIGAPRANMQTSIRNEIIKQCLDSNEKCKLVNCKSAKVQCNDDPGFIMKVLQSSTFCLQPPGDSYTRQSIFLSIIAGCIPVFFNSGSAYVQYIWYLPKNHTKYSVFIQEDEIKNGKANIENVLLGMANDEVLNMRNEVIKLIPRVIYADPRSKLNGKDAFDVAIEGVLERVRKIKKLVNDGKRFVELEDDNWSFYLYGVGAEITNDV